MPLSPFGLLDRWLAPAPAQRRIAWLGEQPYAHRGLHDDMWDGPVLENALPAFTAAIAAGHGIECDVQRSVDNRAVVFHDSEVPSGTVNGVNAVFTLTVAPNPAQSLILAVNGVIQKPGVDFTLSSGTVTFLSGAIPKTGDQLISWYRAGL